MGNERVPRVTICIPTFNRAEVLRSTLKAVLDQGYEDFVVIVSDNASEDDTAEVVASFSDPRFQYLRRERNFGALDNINFVLRQAKTEFVVLLPDDDALLPGGLARAVAAFDRYPNVGVVHSALDTLDADGRVLQSGTNWLMRSPQVRGNLYETGREFIERSVGAVCRICQSTAVIRRSILPDPAFALPEDVPSDVILWLDLGLETDFLFIDAPGGTFRRDDDSLSGRYWRSLPDGDRVLRDDAIEHLRDVKLEWIDRHQPDLPNAKQLRRRATAEAVELMLRSARYEPTRLRSLRRIAQVVRREPAALGNKSTWRRTAATIVRKPSFPRDEKDPPGQDLE
jgi:glycosyltransferase involved in cell wall biosynthesis